MDLQTFRSKMQAIADQDRDQKEVTVTAQTVEEALAQATVELNLPLKDIAYEIIQKPNPGLFKWGGKECILLAYESESARLRAQEAREALEREKEAAAEAESIRKDGKASIRCLNGNVLLIVVPPKGDGKAAVFSDLKTTIKRRGLTGLDQRSIDTAFKECSGESVVVGHCNSSSSGVHAEISFRITDDEMDAYMTLLEPGPGGNDITDTVIRRELKEMGIIKGIDETLLESLSLFPEYGKEFLIAKGKKAENGADAAVEYFFETDKSKLMPVEIDGRVDYKNMNFIQNVVQGQVLAKKVLACQGQNGYTVFGTMLFAKDGKDMSLVPGENTSLSDDENSVIADINGQVLLGADKKISISPVFTVPGDVNIKNGGNIDFIGAVVVKGNVEDGFSVKATQNISINGTVGKSLISGGADVIISQGITGKDEGQVVCKGNLMARFIGNATVKCEGNVIVRDEILNSNIDANASIFCQSGKRAAIIGGHLRASKKVVVRNLGNASGIETLVEVGFEPEKRERMTALSLEINGYEKDLEEINLNLLTYQNNLRDGIKITKEKFEVIKTLKEKKDETTRSLNEASVEYNEIKRYLDGLKNEGSVSVEGRIYPGVRILIADAEYRIRSEMKFSTFYKEGPMIRIKEFSEERGDAFKTD